MSQALQFTQVFDPANPPKKMQLGGSKMSTTPVAVNKVLEATGIKTEAIKDLERPPPVSVAEGPKNLYETLDIPKPIGPGGRYDDSFLDLLNNNFFKTPNIMPGMILKDKFINMPMLRDGINRSKDLQMIMRAQNDQSGINAVVDNTPIARLKRMDYNGIV